MYNKTISRIHDSNNTNCLKKLVEKDFRERFRMISNHDASFVPKEKRSERKLDKAKCSTFVRGLPRCSQRDLQRWRMFLKNLTRHAAHFRRRKGKQLPEMTIGCSLVDRSAGLKYRAGGIYYSERKEW